MSALELTTLLAEKVTAIDRHDWRKVNEIDRRIQQAQEARRLAPFAEYLNNRADEGEGACTT